MNQREPDKAGLGQAGLGWARQGRAWRGGARRGKVLKRKFILELTSLPGHQVPEIVRLRAVLKRLLRTLGFRCLRIEEVPVAPTENDVAKAPVE